MRIFQIIDLDFSILNNPAWYHNLYETLVEMGHDVFLFDCSPGRKAANRHDSYQRYLFSQSLFNTFRNEHSKKPFDLFFAYLKDGMVEPTVLDEVRKYGVPTCNFSCNNIHQFDLVDELSPYFDYNLHAEKDARESFLAIGANPFWWPMASNPKYFKPYDVPRTIPVSFCGANYALRARYVTHLLENGVDLHVYGLGWRWGERSRFRLLAKRVLYLGMACLPLSPQRNYWASANLADLDFRRCIGARFPGNAHPPVPDEELIKLYSRSQISLGFLDVYNRHDSSQGVLRHMHLREFEAPMCGALYCTGYTDELAEMFEPDKEVIVYRSRDELLDKVRFYLAHPDEGERIRRAGLARALQDHTYQTRYRKLFDRLGLSNHK